jgi:hypothetical protein
MDQGGAGGVDDSYPWPVRTMTGFAKLGYSTGSRPVTERLAGGIFSRPGNSRSRH